MFSNSKNMDFKNQVYTSLVTMITHYIHNLEKNIRKRQLSNRALRFQDAQGLQMRVTCLFWPVASLWAGLCGSTYLWGRHISKGLSSVLIWSPSVWRCPSAVHSSLLYTVTKSGVSKMSLIWFGCVPRQISSNCHNPHMSWEGPSGGSCIVGMVTLMLFLGW